MEQVVLTVDQVAERLQVNEQTIRRWLREGRLQGIAFGGRTGWRISAADLQAFMDAERFAQEAGDGAKNSPPELTRRRGSAPTG